MADSLADASYGAPLEWKPTEPVLPPSGTLSRVRANLAALHLVNQLDAENRYATADEQSVLAQWSGWGAAPEVFDPRKPRMAAERAELRDLLTDRQWAMARRNTLNAHYTDPAIASAMWGALNHAGFSGGRVLEPGCGSGTFMTSAPDSAQMVGVELDESTARIAAALHPLAQIRAEGFQTTRVPEQTFAAVIGNVPFGDFRVIDRVHNQNQHNIHNHFLIKSLALTSPGGYVAAVTSRWTMDSTDDRARREMLELGEFLGAVRLPSKAFQRVAGTDVVTDIVLFRRRDHDAVPNPIMEPHYADFLHTTSADILDRSTGENDRLTMSRYFDAHPAQMLGTPMVGQGIHGSRQLVVSGSTDSTQIAEQVTAQLAVVVDSAVARGQGLDAGWHNTTALAEVFDRGLHFSQQIESDHALGTLRLAPGTSIIERWNGRGWDEAKVKGARRQKEWGHLLTLRDTADTLVAAQRDRRPEAERIGLRQQLNEKYDEYVATYGAINRFRMNEPRPVTQLQHDKALARELKEWRRAEHVASDYPVPENVLRELTEKAWENPKQPYKTYPHLGTELRSDPTFALVLALEDFNEETGLARKSAIFHTDVVRQVTTERRVETLEDAVAATLDEGASVDLQRIGELRGVDRTTLEDQLAQKKLAFRAPDDPDTWLPAAQYLSGNVRLKLAAVEPLAAADERYRPNFEALSEVIPEPLRASQISVNVGVTWVPASDYEQFIRETFQVPPSTSLRVEHAAGKWSIEIGGNWPSTKQDMTWGVVPKINAASTTFNFEHKPAEDRRIPHAGMRRATASAGHSYGALEMLTDLMNAKTPSIKTSKEYKDITGESVHDAATRVAASRVRRMSVEFEQWALHTDPERSERLVERYNELFNATVAPRYSGATKTFPGLGQTFKPYPYQQDAVARICSEPTVLLDHVVGAGKTGTMLMGAMELRRLGLVSKPWLVLPNHLVDQVSREAKQWYPTARVLSGGFAVDATDKKEARRLLLAQSASQDWDMVIVPMSVFVRVPVSAQTQAAFIRDKLNKLEQHALSAGDGEEVKNKNSVKEIEKAKERLETRLADVLEKVGTDVGLDFESAGCDYLFVDEAHSFKNLARVSDIAELSCGGSDQALDLEMKLGHLRDRRKEEAQLVGISESAYVERVATFATGTKVSNSLAEEWVMQTYLAPDKLEYAEVSDLTAWGKAFTQNVTRVELNTSGTNLSVRQRVGEFHNVGDLVAISSTFTDSVTRDQVPAELPTLTRDVVAYQPDQEVLDFIADLGYRASNAPRDMRIDNSLKVANDGRNVSLSAVTAHLDRESRPENRRSWQVTQRVLSIHDQYRNTHYLDAQKQPSPVPGGLQVLFCDRSTPKGDGSYSLYDEIRDELIRGGIPAEKIQFIHDHSKDQQKAALFQACREGRVSVLMGSTEKMGTGMNVQDRLTAVHHVDAPWKPADMEQRLGRGLRQGNQNSTILELSYIAERTFDTVMWQTLHRKAHFIEQLAKADRNLRSMPDIGGDSFADSAATTKAIATGDPRYMRQVMLSSQVDEVQAEADAHFAEQRSIERDRKNLRWQVPAQAEAIARLDAAIEPLKGWAEAPEKSFTMVIADETYTDKAAASAALVEELRRQAVLLKDQGMSVNRAIGEVAGYTVEVNRPSGSMSMRMRFAELPVEHKEIDLEKLFNSDLATDGDRSEQARRAYNGGYLTRLQNLAAAAPAAAGKVRWRHQQDVQRLDDLEAQSATDFPRARELQDMQTELAALREELKAAESSPEAVAADAARAARMELNGREPGWSLEINPTPAWLEENGFETADEARDAALARQKTAREIASYGEHLKAMGQGEENDASTLRDLLSDTEGPTAGGAPSPAPEIEQGPDEDLGPEPDAGYGY